MSLTFREHPSGTQRNPLSLVQSGPEQYLEYKKTDETKELYVSIVHLFFYLA